MEIFGTDDMSRYKTPIRFVAWDAATNTVYPTLTSSENILFGTNKIYGSVESPVTLTVTDDTHIAVEMSRGWNWISLNVQLDEKTTMLDLVKPLMQTNDSITVKMGADGFYVEGDKCVGTLATAKPDPTQMYAVNISDCSMLRLVGKPVDPATNPVTLSANGWSWIGYTPQNYNNVNAALSDLKDKAAEGDIIKNQWAFAVFHNTITGGSWYGNLEVLYPGQGYKYLSNNTTDVQFCYAKPESAARSKVRRQEPEEAHWNVTSRHADNMTVLGCVVEDGNMVTHGEVGCFVGTECRGRARIGADGRAYIVVQGVAAGESIQCYYWNDESDTEHMVTPSLRYASDATLGTFANPLQLILDDASGIMEVTEADGDCEYYNLQGLRVDRLTLQCGSIYIRTNGVVSDKILKK